jgi:hypothetical protein
MACDEHGRFHFLPGKITHSQVRRFYLVCLVIGVAGFCAAAGISASDDIPGPSLISLSILKYTGPLLGLGLFGVVIDGLWTVLSKLVRAIR